MSQLGVTTVKVWAIFMTYRKIPCIICFVRHFFKTANNAKG